MSVCGARDGVNAGLYCDLPAGHEGTHFMQRDGEPPRGHLVAPTPDDPSPPPGLRLVDSQEPLPAERPTRDEMLEAVPVDVEIAEDVDLDAADPARLADSPRRLCISTRRAGGRCTASAMGDSLLCSVHSGRLDPSAGGHARARKLREAGETQAETARLGRLGTRAVIAETLGREAALVRATVLTLLRNAAQGDRQAALAVIPYMNQGLGMPTERVKVEASEGEPLEALSQSELAQRVADLRARRQNPGSASDTG